MKKEPTVPSLVLKALEIFSALKQKLYILNQKEWKLLVTKNADCSSFKYKVEKTGFHFFQVRFFLFREKV